MTGDDFRFGLQKITDAICDLANDGMDPANLAGMPEWCNRADDLEKMLKFWLAEIDHMAVVADDHYCLLEESEE